ncbi:hypothetical protein FIBSPDRAFT_866451 [Athelia psychrophila]|uniref:Uncharacterized protein n=1 Tax=Athelia psychrophila TaxID=1759441 RepID=A0A166EPY2_9AGAM|nr:hypothetical protein FIBSPDRAFT_866451 [Fibularhizoctonia sp. CBS 109695]
MCIIRRNWVYPAIVDEFAAPGAAVGRRRSAKEIDAARPLFRRWVRVGGYPWGWESELDSRA